MVRMPEWAGGIRMAALEDRERVFGKRRAAFESREGHEKTGGMLDDESCHFCIKKRTIELPRVSSMLPIAPVRLCNSVSVSRLFWSSP